MQLNISKRTLVGKKVKHLRKENLIPGILFSKKTSQESKGVVSIQLHIKDFLKVYNEAGESSVIDLTMGDDKLKALITEVQFDAITSLPLHVNLFKVDLTEKIKAHIPVELIGIDTHPITKSGLGTIVQIIKEIEVTSLPQDLPQQFDVSLELLKEVGDVLLIKDAIKTDPNKVTILTDVEEVLAKADYLAKEEVKEVVAETETVETVVITDEKKKEREAELAKESKTEEKK